MSSITVSQSNVLGQPSTQQKPHEYEVVQDHDAAEEQAISLTKPPADLQLTLAMFMRAISDIGSQIVRLSHEWYSAPENRRYTYTDYALSEVGGGVTYTLPRLVLSLPKLDAFSSSKLGNLFERAHVFIRAQMPFIARLTGQQPPDFSDLDHDVFRAFFDEPELFPMPAPIITPERDFWTSDACFTDQFLHGCNPTMIQLVESYNQIECTVPSELLPCRDEYGRSIHDLIHDRALLIVDYIDLYTSIIQSIEAPNATTIAVDQESGSFTNPVNFIAIGSSVSLIKYFYAPYVAFYRKHNPEEGLGVLGIVLTRFKDRRNEVYNPVTCKTCPNIYTFAKMHVACADNQMHQFYYHLGRCHLTFEPFAVAARNVFHCTDCSNHIVGALLRPHFRDHIAINWLARRTLITGGKDTLPFTDASFAAGSRGGLILFAEKYRNWSLADEALPARLRSRGFDPEGNDGIIYHYREDGMRVWRALFRYIHSALVTGYPDGDTQVANDSVLDDWCSEMRDPKRAAVPSFPSKFNSLDQLANTLTTIIYTVSAEHSAVNLSMKRYLSYVPNRPNSLYLPVPPPRDDGTDIRLEGEVLALRQGLADDNDVAGSMPLSFAFFQVQFAQLLTLPASFNLLQLDAPFVPEASKCELRKELLEAHRYIRHRNQRSSEEKPCRALYEFLDPAVIAQSIEI